ncbi:MAG: sigma-54 dependent transcriptional regulator [Kofleriaceae bacterium]
MKAHRVLLVNPDDEARQRLHLVMDRAGLVVAATGDLDVATKQLDDCDVVIAVPELVRALIASSDRPPVIALLATRDHVLAKTLLGAGVDDILIEPVDPLAIQLMLHRLEWRPKKAIEEVSVEQPLIGDGPAMQKLRATIKTVAATKTTVLITGETGTGKELVARAIHDASPRRTHRFVAVNCAAIPEPLLESELFGHVRGAFTDAVRDKTGLVEEADHGTLFLDEIGEMPLALQSKLLRVLQESELRRVGDTQPISVDVRLVAATLRNLEEEVAAGRFREDLFYRLNVVPLHTPPLRERPEDIPQLAQFFAARHANRHHRDVKLADDTIAALSEQPWPGNVRDLENTIERLVVLADGPTVDRGFLSAVTSVRPQAASVPDDQELSIKKATRAIEQDLIRRALGVTQGNRTNAAKLLEISHRALLYKMKEYGIS